MDTMLNEGHYLGREGCLFLCGMVPEPGATTLAPLAATQKSLLGLRRLCGYAMPGQEVSSPRPGAKPCSFLPEHVHLKRLKIEGLGVCKIYSGPEPSGFIPKGVVLGGPSVHPCKPGTLPPRPCSPVPASVQHSSGTALRSGTLLPPPSAVTRLSPFLTHGLPQGLPHFLKAFPDHPSPGDLS